MNVYVPKDSMKLFSIAFVAFFLVAALFASAQDQPSGTPRDFTKRDKIVGGRFAILANWPGQAVLRLVSASGPKYMCGGTLVTSQTVLTAAHCVKGYYQNDGNWYDVEGRPAEIVLDADDLRQVKANNIHQIADVVIHPQYQSASKGNDIALIQLKAPASGAQSRISLQRESDPSRAWVTPIMVSGFGTDRDGGGLKQFRASDGSSFYAGVPQLLETTVPLTDHAACQAVYGAAAVGDGQICAGFVEGGRDSCQGDSGGALVAFDRNGYPYQVGIVSWGSGCARESAYGIYTRVSSHAAWLQQQVRGVRSVNLTDVSAPTSPASELVESTFLSLHDELPGTRGRATIRIPAGAKLRLGDAGNFSVKSDIAGRLLLIDINANGDVAQLYPNQFSSGATIAAGGEFNVPDNNDYRFPAQEPIGRGKLVALIVPETFNVQALNEAKRVKGFSVAANLSYLQNLIKLIRIARGTEKGFGTESTGATPTSGSGEATGWALADLDYEITR
jgi:secreted trypsin-like serine protease